MSARCSLRGFLVYNIPDAEDTEYHIVNGKIQNLNAKRAKNTKFTDLAAAYQAHANNQFNTNRVDAMYAPRPSNGSANDNIQNSAQNALNPSINESNIEQNS